MIISWADQWHKPKESPQQQEAPLRQSLRCPSPPLEPCLLWILLRNLLQNLLMDLPRNLLPNLLLCSKGPSRLAAAGFRSPPSQVSIFSSLYEIVQAAPADKHTLVFSSSTLRPVRPCSKLAQVG